MNKKKDYVDVHKEKQVSSRRHFLKKAVYKAPAIIALGHLTRPTNARADRSNAINDDPKLGHPGNFW
jgi:hypothetical protein